MNEMIVNLPCGFDTTYGELVKGEKKKKCMMCEEEDLDIQSVLNLPANRLRLKQKQIELEIENLKNLSGKQ